MFNMVRYNSLMHHTRLPDSVAAQYSELLRHAVHPTPDGSNLSFKSKRIAGKIYWYLYVSLGRRRSEHYLGAQTPALLETIEHERKLWESTSEDRVLRARLVSMLLAGGAMPTLGDEAKVLRLLERGGIFLAGGVIIGTIAFQAYANLLGVSWETHAQTRDIDIVDDTAIPVAVTADDTLSLPELLERSGMGFIAVPSLDRKAPSTAYRIRGRELSVEVLTPMIGKPDGSPKRIPQLGAWAEPVRYIGYLLEDVQIAVLLHGHGVLVNVPSPARFALHKLVVSRRRPATFAEKARRDLAQAEMLLEVLVEERPGDVALAGEAAAGIGGKFVEQMCRGLDGLPSMLAGQVRRCAPDLPPST